MCFRYEKELEVAALDDPAADILPESIAQLRQELDNFVKCQQDNREARSTLLQRLTRNADDTLRLRSELPQHATVSEATRKLFERDLTLHYQELEKLNLSLEIEQYKHTIRVLKDKQASCLDIIKSQHEVIAGALFTLPKLLVIGLATTRLWLSWRSQYWNNGKEIS